MEKLTIRWGGKALLVSVDEALSVARAVLGSLRSVAPARTMCLADDFATPAIVSPALEPTSQPKEEVAGLSPNPPSLPSTTEPIGPLQRAIVDVVGAGMDAEMAERTVVEKLRSL